MTLYKCLECNIQWKDKRYTFNGLRVMPSCPKCLSREYVVSGKNHKTKGIITPL